MQVHVVDDARARAAAEVPAEVVAVRARLGRERGDCRRREPVDLEHLAVCQVAVVADVAHRRGHHVP